MNTVLVFGNSRMLGQFKTALELAAPQTMPNTTMEHDAARHLYLLASRSMEEIARDTALVPRPYNVAFILAQEARRVRMIGLPDNYYGVKSADELSDLIRLTEPEIAKLQEHLFALPPPGPVIRVQQGGLTLDLSLTQFLRLAAMAPEAEPQPKRLPETWDKRLREDTVEPAVDTTADDNRCIICAEDRQKSVLFIPCDHLVCCEVCARKLMTDKGVCPMCRDPVEDVRRVKKC